MFWPFFKKVIKFENNDCSSRASCKPPPNSSQNLNASITPTLTLVTCSHSICSIGIRSDFQVGKCTSDATSDNS